MHLGHEYEPSASPVNRIYTDSNGISIPRSTISRICKTSLKIQWKPIPFKKVSHVTYHSNLIPKSPNMIYVYTAPRIHFLLKMILLLRGTKRSQCNEYVNLPMCSASNLMQLLKAPSVQSVTDTQWQNYTLISTCMFHTVWHVAYFWCVSSVLLVSECICCLHLHGKTANFVKFPSSHWWWEAFKKYWHIHLHQI